MVSSNEERALVSVRPEERVEILLRLLQLNREEIRGWQQTLFQASLWFNGGIVAIAAFVYENDRNSPAELPLALMAAGIACLSFFYYIFSRVARSAIEMSGQDLLKLQHALRLHEAGSFVPGEAIYSPADKWLPQDHIIWLRALNIVICLLAIIALFV